MGEVAEKPRLHASALGMLSSCGMQYYYRYVLGIKRPPSAAQIRGIAAHESIAEHMRDVRDQAGEDRVSYWAPERLRDNAARHFDGHWDQAGEIEFQPGEDPREVRGAEKDMVVGLSALHGQFASAVQIRPELVEERFDVELEGFPFDLSGYVDIYDMAAGRQLLRDTKTSRKSPSEADVIDSIQAQIYPMGVEVLTGDRPKDFQLDVLVERKRSRSVVSLSRAAPPTNDGLLLRVESAAKTIESGAFTPANPSWWGCSKKWCGYWNDCPFGAAHRTVIATKTEYDGE